MPIYGNDATLRGNALAGGQVLGLDHRRIPLAQHGGQVTESAPSAAAVFAALRSRHRRLYDAADELAA